MHSPMQRKYAAEAAHGGAASRGRWFFLARLYRLMWKFAAVATALLYSKKEYDKIGYIT